MTAHAKYNHQPKPDSPVPVALQTPGSGKDAGKVCFFSDCPHKIRYPKTKMRQLRAVEDGMVFCEQCKEDLDAGYKRIKLRPSTTPVSAVQPYREPRKHFAIDNKYLGFSKCHRRRDCRIFLDEQKLITISRGKTIEDYVKPYDTPLDAYYDQHQPCEVCENDHGIPWL